MSTLDVNIRCSAFQSKIKKLIGITNRISNVCFDSNSCELLFISDALKGNHKLKCKNGGYIGIRHNAFRDILAEESNFAGFITRKEVKGLSNENGAKPAYILKKNLMNGKDCVIDTTIGHSLVDYKQQEISNLDVLEKKKIEKYRKLINFKEKNLKFLVCAMGTLGGMNKGTLQVIDRIAESRSKISLSPKNEIKKDIINKITVSMFRNIAKQIKSNFEFYDPNKTSKK